MASRATAAVAGHHAVVRPGNGLLVDELYSGVAGGLDHGRVLRQHIFPVSCGHHASLAFSCSQALRPNGSRVVQRTCKSKSVCSNRGPTIAALRGLWLRDQISFRLGAWASSVGGWLKSFGAGDWVEAGVTAFSSNCRAVVVKDRWARRVSPRAVRRLAADIMLSRWRPGIWCCRRWSRGEQGRQYNAMAWRRHMQGRLTRFLCRGSDSFPVTGTHLPALAGFKVR